MKIKELLNKNINVEGNRYIYSKIKLNFKNLTVEPLLDRESSDWYSTFSIKIEKGGLEVELEEEFVFFEKIKNNIIIYNNNIKIIINKRNLKFIIK